MILRHSEAQYLSFVCLVLQEKELCVLSSSQSILEASLISRQCESAFDVLYIPHGINDN